MHIRAVLLRYFVGRCSRQYSHSRFAGCRWKYPLTVYPNYYRRLVVTATISPSACSRFRHSDHQSVLCATCPLPSTRNDSQQRDYIHARNKLWTPLNNTALENVGKTSATTKTTNRRRMLCGGLCIHTYMYIYICIVFVNKGCIIRYASLDIRLRRDGLPDG